MKCIFVKEDNKMCEANCISNSQYCFSHDPSMAEAKQQADKKGGEAPKKIMLKL